MAQATVDPSSTEDPKEAARRRTRLVVEAIMSFDAHSLDSQKPTTSYDSLASAGQAYLLNVVVWPTREHRSIWHGLVHMVDDSDILVVSRARGNAI